MSGLGIKTFAGLLVVVAAMAALAFGAAGTFDYW